MDSKVQKTEEGKKSTCFLFFSPPQPDKKKRTGSLLWRPSPNVSRPASDLTGDLMPQTAMDCNRRGSGIES